MAEGALLGSYRYRPTGKGADQAAAVTSIAVISPLAGRRVSTTESVTTAQTIARAVATAREWVNIPPNLLYPASFAEEAKTFLKDAKVSVEVLDDKALTKGGYGGILAVGGGSSRLPRLVRIAYSPRGAKHHLALVGKGITFDSGGLNLKPGDSMYTMKCDMAGAAAVIAAVGAIADLGLRVKVTAYASLAENLPSDTAYRPSDVLTMYGGKTVENGNTDAEGRLVMADAIARASEDAPDLIVDMATLTGAAVVALGDKTAGLMASDDDTADRVLDAAEAAGEDVWQLPIPKHIRPKLDSKVADLRSTSGDRAGGALVAAAFLREFVGEGIAWAHVDIAGPGVDRRRRQRLRLARRHRLRRQDPRGTGTLAGGLKLRRCSAALMRRSASRRGRECRSGSGRDTLSSRPEGDERAAQSAGEQRHELSAALGVPRPHRRSGCFLLRVL